MNEVVHMCVIRVLTVMQVIVRIAIIIFVAEFVVMLILSVIPHELSVYSEALLDSALLMLLSTPPIYMLVIRPFVTARNEALAQVNHLALTDPLTQLANRRLISIHLEKLIAGGLRHNVHGAVLLLDIDELKLVNDTYGHDAGDAVLVEMATRLRSITRAEDIAGRLGGDEFVVLIAHLDAEERIARDKAAQVAKTLIDRIKEPCDFRGKALYVGASVGIRILGAEELDVDTAIAEADRAMYRAKQAGKGCAVFFEIRSVPHALTEVC